jgi:curved DNA-binding protein CbpA
VNPFRVLQVSAQASEADIKRAYARLLKQHRPEDDPDGFASLRQAYERAMQIVRERLRQHEHSLPIEPEEAPNDDRAALKTQAESESVASEQQAARLESRPIIEFVEQQSPRVPAAAPQSAPEEIRAPKLEAQAGESEQAIEQVASEVLEYRQPSEEADRREQARQSELEPALENLLRAMVEARHDPEAMRALLENKELESLAARDALEWPLLSTLVDVGALPASSFAILQSFFGWDALKLSDPKRALIERFAAPARAYERLLEWAREPGEFGGAARILVSGRTFEIALLPFAGTGVQGVIERLESECEVAADAVLSPALIDFWRAAAPDQTFNRVNRKIMVWRAIIVGGALGLFFLLASRSPIIALRAAVILGLLYFGLQALVQGFRARRKTSGK